MVAEDSTIQLFRDEITADDLMLFVNGDRDAIKQRFKYSAFLPPYLAIYEAKVDLHRIDGTVSESEAKRLHEKLNEGTYDKNNSANFDACLALAAHFISIAFSLFDILKNKDMQAITEESLIDLGYIVQDDECSISFEIPACEYLLFVSEALKTLTVGPFWLDAHLYPKQEEEKEDPIISWLATKGGARLSIAFYKGQGQTNRDIVATLLKSLLDIHLASVQIVADNNGEIVKASTCALSALWTVLQETFSTMRPYRCRVCGKPYLATNERKEKARYCPGPGSACKQAYALTRKVLKLIDNGESIDNAASSIKGISKERALNIAKRNVDVFALEYTRIDFKDLLKGV